MKRWICILSVLIFTFSSASCGNSSNNDVSSVASTIDYNALVPDSAAKGEIYGAQFAVGANVDDVVAFYNGTDKTAESEGGSTTSVPELDEEIAYDLTIRGLDTDDKIIKMYADDTRYFYYNKSKESGVAFIAYFGSAFDYTSGYTPYETIKNTIEAQPAMERIATDEDQFFTVQPLADTKMLTYKFGDYVLSFFFMDNNLFATTIYDMKVWSETDYLSK